MGVMHPAFAEMYLASGATLGAVALESGRATLSISTQLSYSFRYHESQSHALLGTK